MRYRVSKKDKNLIGEISLERSKSIANRLLIIQALCEEDFTIHHLSQSDDTNTLVRLLNSSEETLDVGAAGTTMRFLTAYFSALENRTVILRGSERMHQRPIKVLVDALVDLGADIQYLENDGYPPLKINGRGLNGGHVAVNGDVSSQYITALLLIGPCLKEGIQLVIVGDLVSRPYVQMTLDLLVNFGIEYTWEGNKIEIKHQSYQAKDIEVEADWSAASYWFEMAAFADNVDLKIKGLVDPSLQGDSVLRSWMQSFGVDSVYENGWMKLSKSNASEIPDQLDFILCPDIAQTFACVYAGLGKNAKFDGVQTLKIKETDRVQALQNELSKFGATIHVQNDAVFDIEGIVKSNDIAVDTYEDHRMAMSFAPLAMVMDEIIINEPMVVTKSYPKYWEDLKSVGFDIESL